MTATLWASETLVNTTTFHTQGHPAVTALTDGGYVVVWTDASAGDWDLRGQRFAADGTRLGEEFTVVETLAAEVSPAVTALSSGQFSVSWLSNGDVVTRRFNADGTSSGVGGQMILPEAAEHVATATFAGASRVVVFDYDGDIYRVTYNADGVQVGGLSRVNTLTQAVQSQPDVTALNGGYVVTWRVEDGPLRARIFDHNGDATGPDIEISPAGGSGREAKVTPLAGGAGGFVVTWEGGAGALDTWARAFSYTGQPLGPEVRVNLLTPGGQKDPDVVGLADGTYMVIFHDTHAGVIRAQQMDPSGARIGGPLIVSTDGPAESSAHGISAALLADGRVVITWANFETNGDDSGAANIRMAIVDPRDGLIEGRPGMAVETLYGGTGVDQVFGLSGRDIVYAGAGNDSVYGGGGNDDLMGEKGDDLLRGGAGVDELRGGLGDDHLTGDGGNDVLVGGLGADTLNGGLGSDFADFGEAAAAVTIDLSTGVHAGEAAGDVFLHIEAFDLSEFGDRFTGDAANNHVTGGGGADELRGGGGADALGGDAGDDKLYGDAGDDSLYGFEGVDRVYGGDGNDVAAGGVGADLVYGEAGDDMLIGGAGADQLFGGAGADRFWYDDLVDSGLAVADRDQIKDFSRAEGDKIDLSDIDAVSGAGDQAFAFVQAFTGVAGQLIARQNGAKTMSFVEGDVTGDGQADFRIVVAGSTVLEAGDFIL